MENKQYIYLDSEKAQVGPIPGSVLKQMVQAGIVSEETRIWTDGFPTWLPFSTVFPAAVEEDIPPIPDSTARVSAAPIPQPPPTPPVPTPPTTPEQKSEKPRVTPPPYVPSEYSASLSQTPPPPPSWYHEENEEVQEAPSNEEQGDRDSSSPTLPPPPPTSSKGWSKPLLWVWSFMGYVFLMGLIRGSCKMVYGFSAYNSWSVVLSILDSGAFFALLFYMAGKQRAQQFFSLLLLIVAVGFVLDVIILFIPENVGAALGLLYLLVLVITLHQLKYSGKQIAMCIGFMSVLGIIESLLLEG